MLPRMTGGNYYRAKNTKDLEGIYDAIDKLETSKIHVDEWVEYEDLYPGFFETGILSADCFFHI